MPRKIVTWVCNKCGKRFSDFKGADSCEFDHIVTEAAERTRAAISKAFQKKFGGDHA